ncbi:bifunctional diguanylate cyclase/phosphodiesterase [Ferribacterium limneticum]|uniref:bifunctional diguanylate cyclase/phosphodiesterase n=1 Tax=Ferribacterium limneticum TaxID=76259 RepID=UPI001CFBBBFA|nr:EAL domain-containing protein [Ferribacterium limneticum]
MALFTGLILIASLLLLAWWLALQRLEAEKTLIGENARVQQETLAEVISENLTQVLDRGRLISIAANEWFDGKQLDAASRLSSMRATDRALLRITLYDHDLKQIYSSSPTTESLELIDSLQAFLKEVQNGTSTKLAVGPRSMSYEQAWELPLLFPVGNHSGRLNGILVVVLDLGYFLGLYQHIDIGRSGVIQVLKFDGEKLAEARQAGLVLDINRSVMNLPKTEAQKGTWIGQFFDAGHTYRTSFRNQDNHPLIVTVSRDVDETLNDRISAHTRLLAILGFLTAIIVLATFWFARNLKHQGLLLSALSKSDQEKQELIAELQEEKRRAFDLAAHDHLTGLPNRRIFHELVVSHIASFKRSRKLCALMYLDLDRFKAINDNLGHHVGDLLLQTISIRLREALRESDVIARLGGDEFGLMLTGIETIDDAALVASKIIESIGLPCTNLDGHDIQITPSIGIAIFPRDGQDLNSLTRHADTAMYQSKRAGRGRFTFYDPALNQGGERLFNLEQRLSKAIAENELVLHFQPKVRLSDYRIVGLEALVRWQHPDHGLIYPNDFIPMAERIGLIDKLGDWVAQACCIQLAQWQAEGVAVVPIAFNVSAKQLLDIELPQRIAEYLAIHGVAPGNIEIEITENSLVDSIEVARQILERLEALGVGISLDDFGNGFSNLAYIRTLPIHCLKIDREFINNIRNRHDDAVIVSSIITLAHNLNMRVVAEGVEMSDQLIHLKTAGCDEAQGYYLSRPVPAVAARELLISSTMAPA